jgi:hypothetical protein
MAKNNGLGLPQTKGTFQFSGIILGTSKDNFYKETKTKTNKPFRSINFGLQVAKDSVLYLSLNGMPMDKVFYSKSEKDKDGKRKTETKEVAWAERYKFKSEGFRLIGMNIGLTKTTDEKGNEVNDKQYLVAFDACEYISQNLKDGQSVFVNGHIEYSHFANQNGEVTRSIKYIPDQISLCKPIDFENEKYEVKNAFTQPIVLMGVEKTDENVIVSGKIINYNSIEDVDLIIEKKPEYVKFYENLKKLKPYTLIELFGEVQTIRNTEEVVEEDDGWGGSNPMKRVNNPYKRIMVIRGGNKESIDDETYSEDAIEKAMLAMNSDDKAKKDFGDDEGWGDSKGKKPTEDDDTPWD